jgi:hypothetical protein
MKMIVHPNNNNNIVQVNHRHLQAELGDQNLVCPMKLVIIFVMFPVRIPRLVGVHPMKIVIGVHERRNV